MKSTDLYQIQINHFGSHIVVDLMIVIIITAISIFLLKLLILNSKNNNFEIKGTLNKNNTYELVVLSVLIITHILFGLWPVIMYGLEESLSAIELFILPFSYGLYLTFFMKKMNGLLDQKVSFMKALYFKNTLRLFLHFSIVPLLIVSILVLIN